MRIDSHVCFYPDHPPEHLLAVLQRNRFDGAILVVDDPPDSPLPPPIVGWLLRDPAALDAVIGLPGLLGVCCKLRAGLGTLAQELAARGLPLDVEMEPANFPLLLELAAGAPELRIVIDHLARPDFGQSLPEDWLAGMAAAARSPRIYCKISGLLAYAEIPWRSAPIRPFVQQALQLFGPARSMFGSEWPRRLPDITWKESLAAFTQSIGAQPQEVREQLLGGTAREFYGIDARPRVLA